MNKRQKDFPRVLSVGYAVPCFTYSQREIFEIFDYPEHFWRIFQSAGIDQRQFCGAIEDMRLMDFQQQQEIYAAEARRLSELAVMECLDLRDTSEIGKLSYSSCTGICPGPVMGQYLAHDLNLKPNVYPANNLFQGCDGGFPGFRQCVDFTRETGRPSLVISCELSSCTYYPEKRGEKGKPDPENAYELLRSHALFADAASCVLIGYNNRPKRSRYPEILDTETYLDTRYLGDLGYTWRNGRLRVLLSKRVPQIAAELSGKVVPILLDRWGLSVPQIAYWIIHPAGKIVLDLIGEKLEIEAKKLFYSREALRRYGNCSSASVGIIAKLLMQNTPNPLGFGVMLNIGPGMTADATLLHFN